MSEVGCDALPKLKVEAVEAVEAVGAFEAVEAVRTPLYQDAFLPK